MSFLPTTQVVLQLLKDGLGTESGIKGFFEGDPGVIGQSYYPCICVLEKGDDDSISATSTDAIKEMIEIRVIFNKKDDFGASDTADLTERKIYQLYKARDENTLAYLPTTIKGILRTQLTLNNTVINVDMKSSSYDNKRPDGVFTQEKHISLMILRRIIISNRS